MTFPEAVFVTGASAGIGEAIVKYLAERDVLVFAAVRDLDSVAPHPHVTPVRLDVTSADEALAAASLVRDRLGDRRLRGIVNNAGIAVGGPLEFLPLDDLRRQIEVNVIGQLAVTQAFLPLLRELGIGDPRIVFTGSMSSRVALPFFGPYAASKFGLLALATSLRRELREWGFKVSVIEPGTVATPIWDKGQADVAAAEEALPQRGRELYSPHLGVMRAILRGGKKGIPPSSVAEVVHKALFDRYPRTEYLVGADARALVALSALLPAGVVDRMVAMEFGRRGRS
jgi:NAD(P)-dependent dehydrogenase (short-subunit alcohol dehydrogenase family)